jgi:hypothetical protein
MLKDYGGISVNNAANTLEQILLKRFETFHSYESKACKDRHQHANEVVITD